MGSPILIFLRAIQMAIGNASDMVAKVVDEVLEQVQKLAPEKYAQAVADPERKAAVAEAARSAATEQLALAKELAGRPDDIENRLRKHLPEGRIELIREGLKLPTFRMDIAKKSDGKHWIELTAREGKTFKPPRQLAAASDVDWATMLQYASILVEAWMLVMSAVGVTLDPASETIERVVDDVADAIESSPELERALQEFVADWKATSDVLEKAKALFLLIKDTRETGKRIIHDLASYMAWFDYLRWVVKGLAMLAVAIATEGGALLLKISLAIVSAVKFVRKIDNVNQLNTLKGTICIPMQSHSCPV